MLSDVRFVIHMGLTKNKEAYYQVNDLSSLKTSWKTKERPFLSQTSQNT